MKKILKALFGKSLVSYIRKYFPSDVQKKLNEEEAEETQMRYNFYKLFIKPGELCFDVGANLGNRVAPLLATGAKVVAVEPQKSCYEYLKTKFGKKIILVTKGLGAEEGVKEFFISSGTVLSSFSEKWIASVKDGRFKDYEWAAPVLTEITTLDLLIKEFGVPTFIKIDVEGYELEVLSGLTQPINMISFEYTLPEQMEHPLNCIKQILNHSSAAECNYSIAESMNFAMERWLPAKEMLNLISTQEFINTGFGDIYVRTKVQ